MISSAAVAFLMVTSCMASKVENHARSPRERELVSSEGEKGAITPYYRIMEQDYIPGEVLVKFKEGVSEERITAFSKKFSLVLLEKVKKTSIYRFRLTGDRTVPEAIDILKQQNEVKTAQPNYFYRFERTKDGIKIR
jgi:hypothetical protein